MNIKGIIRRALELLLRGVVIKRTIECDGKKQKIFVTPDSQLKYLKTKFDTDLKLIVDKYILPESTVFDIGANCGTFGFMANLKGADKVYFFEPDPFLSHIIQKTISLNSLWKKCTLVPLALAEKPGLSGLDVAARGRASNSLIGLGRSQKGGARYTSEIFAINLDMFCNIPYSNIFLKIDVEGAEEMLVDGAQDFIAEFLPTILIEVSNENRDRIITKLQNKSYFYIEEFENNLLFIHEHGRIKP